MPGQSVDVEAIHPQDTVHSGGPAVGHPLAEHIVPLILTRAAGADHLAHGAEGLTELPLRLQDLSLQLVDALGPVGVGAEVVLDDGHGLAQDVRDVELFGLLGPAVLGEDLPGLALTVHLVTPIHGGNCGAGH